MLGSCTLLPFNSFHPRPHLPHAFPDKHCTEGDINSPANDVPQLQKGHSVSSDVNFNRMPWGCYTPITRSYCGFVERKNPLVY